MDGILAKVIGAGIAHRWDHAKSRKPIVAVLSTLFAKTLLSPQSASSCEVRRLFPLSLLNRSHETVHHVAQEALKMK